MFTFNKIKTEFLTAVNTVIWKTTTQQTIR